MTRSSRTKLALLLSAVLLLTSCRSWQRFADVSPADMTAGLRMYLKEHYPSRASLVKNTAALEIELRSTTSALVFFILLLMTGGLILPVEESSEIAFRPDGSGGSELAVDITSHWQILFFIPVWSHEPLREQSVINEIVEFARRRGSDQAEASEAVLTLLGGEAKLEESGGVAKRPSNSDGGNVGGAAPRKTSWSPCRGLPTTF